MSKHLFRLLFGAFFLVAATAFTGCSDDDDKSLTPKLTADPTALDFTDETATTQTVAITANCEWTVTASNLDWATISPMSGKGNGTISVTVSELPAGTNLREGKISFTLIHPEFGKWGQAESSVAVKQYGSGVTPPPTGEAVVITIPEIIAKLTTSQVALDTNNDRYFEAVVVTDKEGGNFNGQNLQVMTPGATTAKNVVWSIGKATGTLTVSKTTIKLSLSKLTDTFTIGGNHDGTLSVTSSATGVATVSRSGNTVTVSHVHQTNGEATITVSCTAGTNYSAPASKTVKVTAEFILATLNDNSWAAIHSVSGTGASYWAVGDRKAVAVSGTVGTQAVNGTYYAYIIGFNHNSSKEGNGITFGTFKTALSGGTDICLVDGKYDGYSTNGTKYFNMNHSSNTNSGGWKGCDLRYDVLGSTNTNDGDATATTATNPVANTLMAALPSDLRAVMQPVTKYTDNTGNSSNSSGNVTTTTDYLFDLSEFEVFGARSYANQYEQNYQLQYDYYKAGNTKIANNHTAVTTAVWWGLRSPYYNNYDIFVIVWTGGTGSISYARNSGGLRPGFAA